MLASLGSMLPPAVYDSQVDIIIVQVRPVPRRSPKRYTLHSSIIVEYFTAGLSSNLDSVSASVYVQTSLAAATHAHDMLI